MDPVPAESDSGLTVVEQLRIVEMKPDELVLVLWLRPRDMMQPPGESFRLLPSGVEAQLHPAADVLAGVSGSKGRQRFPVPDRCHDGLPRDRVGSSPPYSLMRTSASSSTTATGSVQLSTNGGSSISASG